MPSGSVALVIQAPSAAKVAPGGLLRLGELAGLRQAALELLLHVPPPRHPISASGKEARSAVACEAQPLLLRKREELDAAQCAALHHVGDTKCACAPVGLGEARISGRCSLHPRCS